MKGFCLLHPSSWQIVRTALFALGLLATLGLTGCQIENGGQTLPSPYYMSDDVQYFPPGPEFKCAREAAAMKIYNNQAQAQEAMER